jgi:hypothetical protein
VTDERPPDVLGSLPRTRPHRRSEKRGAAPAAGPAKQANGNGDNAGATVRRTTRKPASERLRQPAQPAGAPPAPHGRKPPPPTRTDILTTAVQAAAELAEIGLSASARALRGALSRLPRP